MLSATTTTGMQNYLWTFIINESFFLEGKANQMSHFSFIAGENSWNERALACNFKENKQFNQSEDLKKAEVTLNLFCSSLQNLIQNADA